MNKVDPIEMPGGDALAVLSDILVVTVENAVAAPYATSRLAEAGARVIKVERPPGGDFARHYDQAAQGESAHFVWVNQGKESAALDLKEPADLETVRAMLGRADVFVQNVAPGAIERMGLSPEHLRRDHPRLITCSITGYGETGAYAGMKAYDNLVQAETAIFAVTGNRCGPAKVGIPICDIAAGMYAYAGILEALIERRLTGRGRHVSVSLFESVADWMTVPFLFQRYTGQVAQRTALNHASIAPYGSYSAGDNLPVMISVQNDAEWVRFCAGVLRRPDITRHPLFAGNSDRVAHRPQLDEVIEEALRDINRPQLIARLDEAAIAYGLIRGMEEFSRHPALATSEVDTPVGPLVVPRRAAPRTSLAERKRIPAFGAHTAAVRREFGDRTGAAEPTTPPSRTPPTT